ELARVDADLGASLKTAEQFTAIQNDAKALAAKPSDDGYTALVGDLQALIAQVGDASNLILDQQLDAYYVMDALVVETPNAEDDRGQIRGQALAAAEAGSLSADDRANARVLAGAVQGRLDTIKRGFGVAYGATQDATLKTADDPAVQKTLSATAAFLK